MDLLLKSNEGFGEDNVVTWLSIAFTVEAEELDDESGGDVAEVTGDVSAIQFALEEVEASASVFIPQLFIIDCLLI